MLLAVLFLVGFVSVGAQRQLPRHETRYYYLHTDLEVDQARAAAIRMTKMAEEYFRRTKDFGRGQPDRRFDFYLFSNQADYNAAGGPPGSAGVYMRRGNDARLMAFMIPGHEAESWKTVQHEGFHQFADVSIGRLPPWVNEGLAEYFGESIFTGDGYVSGIVDPRRLERIRRTMEENRFIRVEDLMDMTQREWNARLKHENYDQGWAMVHFLAHGDGGRYQRPLADFIDRVGRGQDQVNAWGATFGSTDGMADALNKFWAGYDPADADHLRAEATLRTLTSYLARAVLQGKQYDNFDAFLEGLRDGDISMDVNVVGENWLPDDLRLRVLHNTDGWLAAGYAFEIVSDPRRLQLRMTEPDGTVKLAGYKLRRGLVSEVVVQ